MSKKRPAFSGNPDLRRGMQVPGPPMAEIEAKLLCWLTPESFKPLRYQPVATWYTKNSTAHDQTWTEKLLERLPVRGLLIFDLGFFNFMRIISFLASFVTG